MDKRMKVRLSFWPDVELEVTEIEYANLVAQGVVVDEDNNSKTPTKTEAKHGSSDDKKES